MPTTIQLDNGQNISLDAALSSDKNIVNEVGYPRAREEFFRRLLDQRPTIQALVQHHLGLAAQDTCIVGARNQWIRGSFNVCIPVKVRSDNLDKVVVFRCPMPHKLAEANYPGSINEKLSCEVGAHIWIQDRCPDIPTPELYGFGFSDNRHFTHERQMPFYVRLCRTVQRHLRNYFGYPMLSQYISSRTRFQLPSAYMILECVGHDTGETLSDTWDEQRNNPIQRQTLFKGMARLILSLARTPQPRIGSFEFHDNGTITLTNRPLPCFVPILENSGAPRTIPRNETYGSTEPFVADVLGFHDSSFLNNPNAAHDTDDCLGQMAAKAMLRTLSHHYIPRESRNGPFRLQLTDFHASNIFVDKDWNITCLIDLEWICALPAEALSVPYWLTGRSIDQVTGDNLAEFRVIHNEFMDIFEAEEIRMMPADPPILTRIIQNSWESGTVWFWSCLTSVDAMFPLVIDHICPRFLPLSTSAEKMVSQYWCRDALKVAERKVTDRERHVEKLQALFEDASGPSREKS